MSIQERFFALGKSFPRAALVKGRAFLLSLGKFSGMSSDLSVTLPRCTAGGFHNPSDEDLFGGLPLPRLSRSGESPVVADNAPFCFGLSVTGVSVWSRLLTASPAASRCFAGASLTWILGVFRGLPLLRWTGGWAGAAWGAGWGPMVGICSAACKASWTNNIDLLRKVTEAMGLFAHEGFGLDWRVLLSSVIDMVSAGWSGSLFCILLGLSPLSSASLLFSLTTGKMFWQTEKHRNNICKYPM